MKRIAGVGVVVAAVVWAAGIDAHHSQTAVYQTTEVKAIEGELVQVLIRSPHSFVHVMAKDDDGETYRWAIEWGGAGQLRRQGVDRESLKIGDHVVIEGNPGRNPVDKRLLMKTIVRPSDGWSWGTREGEVVD